MKTGTDPSAASSRESLAAVLEPVKPSAQYDRVEIEQQPIPLGSPHHAVSALALGGAASVRWFLTTQWKALILMVGLAVATELVARRVEPRLVGRVYNGWYTAGYPIDLNEEGFRGPIPAVPKPAGTTRILALGDSVTFGTGVARDSTWPARLEERLRGRADVRLEAVNTGMAGADLAQVERALRKRWSAYDPDVAVLVLTGNMISLAWTRRDEAVEPPPMAGEVGSPPSNPPWIDRLRALPGEVALWGVASLGVEHLRYALNASDHRVDPEAPYGVMLAHGIEQNDLGRDRIEAAYGRAAAQLARLAKTCDELGVPLILTYSPPRFAVGDGPWDNLKSVPIDRLTIDPVARVRSLSERLGVSFVDVSPALEEALAEGREPYVLADYTHLDDAGHAAVAMALEAEVMRALRRTR